MLAEGLNQWFEGKRPTVTDMLLTPANIQRIADQLAHLRGAAMKVGQLLSMDNGDFLPPELAQLLAKLRADANPMPPSQLSKVLKQEWGSGWHQHFKYFSTTPMAAASIGQVHRATLKTGEQLAIKVQYPGVKASIESDVDNVIALLNLSGVIPSHVDYRQLVEDAKQQLKDEANYIREAEALELYRHKLTDETQFALPKVYSPLTTPQVLAMTYLDGVPLDSLQSAPQTVRDNVAKQLFTLMFEELFVHRLMQTDPNWGNYLYDIESQRVMLLDFGATRKIPNTIRQSYSLLLNAALDNNSEQLEQSAKQLGLIDSNTTPQQRQQITQMLMLASKPLTDDEPHDFGDRSLTRQLQQMGIELGRDNDFWQTPPADVLFINRKLSGLYLMAAKLKAKIALRPLFDATQAQMVKQESPKRLSS